MRINIIKVFISSLLFFGTSAYSQTPTNNDLKKMIDTLSQLNNQLKKEVDNQIKLVGPAKAEDPTKQESINERLTKVEAAKITGGRTLELGEYLLVLSPLILFLGLFLLCFKKEWIRESVTDPEKPRSITTTKTNFTSVTRLVDGANVQEQIPSSTDVTTSVESYGKSASRMVLFFSSFLTIILSLSFATVFLYGYLRGNEVPDFTSLVKVLLSLGIGIIPYTVNQFNKPDSDTTSPKTGA